MSENSEKPKGVIEYFGFGWKKKKERNPPKWLVTQLEDFLQSESSITIARYEDLIRQGVSEKVIKAAERIASAHIKQSKHKS